MNFLARIGSQTQNLLASLGQSFVFLLQMVFQFLKPAQWVSLSYQVYRVGVLSLPIILVSGLFIGLVLGLQGYTILSRYGSESSLGTMVALTLIRELGPVVTALLFAGRAGTSVTAELGQMKVNEELSVMSMMGVDPVRQVFTPRFWAGVISLPLLTIMFTAIGIFGGKLVGVDWLGVYEGSYWSNMQNNVSFVNDVMNGVTKSIIFGIICSWISCYQGYACSPSAEGISTATTKTVVYSSLSVLGMDFILTALMFGGIA